MRIILDAELDRLREVWPKRLRRHAQRKVDAGRDAAPRNDVAIEHHALREGYRAECGEHLAAHPMRRSPPALQQSGGTEHQRAGAHARHIARTLRLAAEEIE